MPPVPQLLVLGPLPAGFAGSSWARFEVSVCDGLDAAREQLAARRFDALLLQLPTAADTRRLLVWPALSQACLDAAVVLLTDHPTPALAAELIERGVQDVLASNTLDAPDAVARALQLALMRKRIERNARKAYATDLATGLPNEMQLLEHMSHLLALREREPAPMALLVVRVEGLATAEATHGAAAASALRRKLAVRLRASLRASDVVAAVGSDAFAALLAWIDAPDAGERVAAKLSAALTRPLRLAGRDTTVAVSIGVGRYPEHGKDAQALLRQAFAAAAGTLAIGRVDYSNRVERSSAEAANDDDI